MRRVRKKVDELRGQVMEEEWMDSGFLVWRGRWFGIEERRSRQREQSSPG